MDEMDLDQRLEMYGMDTVVTELHEMMEQARYMAPYTEFAGMIRNEAVKALTEYLNVLNREYQFQQPFEVKYIESKQRPTTKTQRQ